MSADDGYLVREREDGTWAVQHYFLSADRPDINAKNTPYYSSLDAALYSWRDLARETEYGFEVEYYNNPKADLAREIQKNRTLVSDNMVSLTKEDLNTVRVYLDEASLSQIIAEMQRRLDKIDKEYGFSRVI